MRIPALICLLAGLVACRAPERHEFAAPHMGTEFRLVLYAADEAQAAEASARAFRRIVELEQALSDYRETSELRRLCRDGAAGDGAPWPVSDDLFQLLARATDVSRRTGGAFDVTVGPYVQLWRRSVRQQELPSSGRLAAARRAVGYERLVLDPEHRTVAFTSPGMRLDTGGVGKGAAADAALEVLRAHGITRALVDAGGDVSVSGPPPDRDGWRVLVDTSADASQLTLVIQDRAVATSGDRYQFLELDGERYSHIVDPRTGLGSTTGCVATVIAPDGATADALASALCVLGPGGLAVIEGWPAVEARVVQGTPPQCQVHETPGFRRWLRKPAVEPAR